MSEVLLWAILWLTILNSIAIGVLVYVDLVWAEDDD
jgi:hypothetical protein